ncbi:MAG: Mitochondrial import inner membrane translocase subunit TIM44 [Marteilia pararefringens]
MNPPMYFRSLVPQLRSNRSSSVIGNHYPHMIQLIQCHKYSIFNNIMSNIKNDISKDKDFQEQLKKFKEEAKKIENSEALLQAREKFNKIEQQTKNAAFNTKDIISDIYDIFLKKNEQLRQSQFVKAPVDKLTTASTQILKKINADKLISSAKNLSDTLVSDSQGSLRYSVYKSPSNSDYCIKNDTIMLY